MKSEETLVAERTTEENEYSFWKKWKRKTPEPTSIGRKAVPERNPGLQEPSAILEVDQDKGR